MTGPAISSIGLRGASRRISILDDGPSPLVGRRIGAYRVIEEVGRGGMGVVFAADDERLGRTVALKALTPEYTRDHTRRERLIREARAAATLSHPAIATIFALEEIDGELYIASELVRGRTLREELRDGPFPAVVTAARPGFHRRGARGRAPARDRPSRSQTGKHHQAR